MHVGIDGLPLAEIKTGVGHYTVELTQHLLSAAPSDYFEFLSYLPPHESLLDYVAHLPPNARFTRMDVGRIRRRWWAIGLPIYLKRHPINLFHGTNYNVPLWGDCATVVTVHDLSLLLYPETHEARRVKHARRRLTLMARRATSVITPTRSVKGEVCEHLRIPSDRVFVVHEAPRRCFYPESPARARRVQERLGIGDKFVLYVGTIEPRKNLLSLVRAFEEVLRFTPLRPQLVIAGKKGWLTDELFAYVRTSGLGDRLLFTGYVSDEDLRALYSACGVMVYPSIYEGAGLPPLEAMACGAPVITSNIPAISEMVGDGARLVTPTDHQSLASQIIELLNDTEVSRRLRSAALKRAALYTWEKTARETYELYLEALRRYTPGK